MQFDCCSLQSAGPFVADKKHAQRKQLVWELVSIARLLQCCKKSNITAHASVEQPAVVQCVCTWESKIITWGMSIQATLQPIAPAMYYTKWLKKLQQATNSYIFSRNKLKFNPTQKKLTCLCASTPHTAVMSNESSNFMSTPPTATVAEAEATGAYTVAIPPLRSTFAPP